MTEETTILAAIASSDFFNQIEPLISRTNLRVTQVRSGHHALSLARESAYDLILVQHPLPDLKPREFFSTIRSEGSASAKTPMIILTRDDRLEPLSEYLDGSQTQACCIDAAPEQLQMALMESVGIALRTSARLGVELSAEFAGKSVQRFCQTANVSETGLLLRYRGHLPVESEVSLKLHIPGASGPVKGLARVIRETDPERESTRGTAVRFISLEGDGRERLADFVRQQADSTL